MTTNSEIILPEHTHIGDSTEVTIVGESYRGDGYYSRSDGLHTIQVSYTEFTGIILIEGTIATSPNSSDWFIIHSFNIEQSTGSQIANITGNYVFVRAVLKYTDGTVNSVRMNH